MIDSLTRRLQQLEEEMEYNSKQHHKELTSVQNERDAIAREKKVLEYRLARAQRKIERLQTR